MGKRRNIGFIALTTLPALLLYGGLFVYPIVQAITMSFYRWSGLTMGTEKYIGLRNYAKLINDRVFWVSFKNSLFLMLTVPLGVMVVSLFLSVLLTRKKLRERSLYRMVYFLPNVLSVVVISMLWQLIYHPTLGILNTLLDEIGLGAYARVWLGDSKTALVSVGMTMIWSNIGFYLVMFMAGINNIPEHLFEAARIDGAGEMTQFFKITLPLLWQILRVAVILLISNAFYGALAFVQVMTNSGPNNATLTMVNYMYNLAFQNSNLGYATTVGVAIFVVGITLSLLSDRASKRDVVEFQ